MQEGVIFNGVFREEFVDKVTFEQNGGSDFCEQVVEVVGEGFEVRGQVQFF